LSEITALFWDVGGVLLSNAWDRTEREQAFAKFGLDAAEFQKRHEAIAPAFEKGELTLAEYLERTVFYRPRTFNADAFRDYMFSLSQPKPDVLMLARQLAAGGKYFMSTVNNESLEMNEYRIRHFRLQEIFNLFVSSCFVGLRKPDPQIYRLALALTQRPAEKCCFIDDRLENLEWPARLGMHAIQMHSAEQLRQELRKAGVDVT
jgi:putative hydrolase of the HAD superfamily